MTVVQDREGDIYESFCRLKSAGMDFVIRCNHEINTSEDALRIVGYSTARWMREDLFRCVKSEGLNFEKSELESGQSLRKFSSL
jgi:hypothetical protein